MRHEMNQKILFCFSEYLTKCPDYVKPHMIEEFANECGIDAKGAFIAIFQALFGMDPDTSAEDREFERMYLQPAITLLDPTKYRENPYYTKVKIPSVKKGDWEFCQESYAPYEAFIFDDILQLEDGVNLPQMGFFAEEFAFPAVKQKGREWMLITPNEINTMEPVIEKVSGDVVTFGLGMGYFAFMASEKKTVRSVTIVEMDETVISLFETYILPQFPHKDKITVVKDDAFHYVEKEMSKHCFDYGFVDLWHDAGDGLEMYLDMKKLATKHEETDFSYWIEPTLKAYLSEMD